MTHATELFAAPHGLVFVYDPEATIDVPDDTGEAPLLSTETCISVWTIQATDGKVKLTISDDLADARGTKRYGGTLKTKSRRVAINDAEVNEIVGLNVDTDNVFVEIYTDDPTLPTEVVCLVQH